jgi:hypothetical protein
MRTVCLPSCNFLTITMFIVPPLLFEVRDVINPHTWTLVGLTHFGAAPALCTISNLHLQETSRNAHRSIPTGSWPRTLLAIPFHALIFMDPAILPNGKASTRVLCEIGQSRSTTLGIVGMKHMCNFLRRHSTGGIHWV